MNNKLFLQTTAETAQRDTFSSASSTEKNAFKNISSLDKRLEFFVSHLEWKNMLHILSVQESFFQQLSESTSVEDKALYGFVFQVQRCEALFPGIQEQFNDYVLEVFSARHKKNYPQFTREVEQFILDGPLEKLNKEQMVSMVKNYIDTQTSFLGIDCLLDPLKHYVYTRAANTHFYRYILPMRKRFYEPFLVQESVDGSNKIDKKRLIYDTLFSFSESCKRPFGVINNALKILLYAPELLPQIKSLISNPNFAQEEDFDSSEQLFEEISGLFSLKKFNSESFLLDEKFLGVFFRLARVSEEQQKFLTIVLRDYLTKDIQMTSRVDEFLEKFSGDENTFYTFFRFFHEYIAWVRVVYRMLNEPGYTSYLPNDDNDRKQIAVRLLVFPFVNQHAFDLAEHLYPENGDKIYNYSNAIRATKDKIAACMMRSHQFFFTYIAGMVNVVFQPAQNKDEKAIYKPLIQAIDFYNRGHNYKDHLKRFVSVFSLKTKHKKLLEKRFQNLVSAIDRAGNIHWNQFSSSHFTLDHYSQLERYVLITEPCLEKKEQAIIPDLRLHDDLTNKGDNIYLQHQKLLQYFRRPEDITILPASGVFVAQLYDTLKEIRSYISIRCNKDLLAPEQNAVERLIKDYKLEFLKMLKTQKAFYNKSLKKPDEVRQNWNKRHQEYIYDRGQKSFEDLPLAELIHAKQALFFLEYLEKDFEKLMLFYSEYSK